MSKFTFLLQTIMWERCRFVMIFILRTVTPCTTGSRSQICSTARNYSKTSFTIDHCETCAQTGRSNLILDLPCLVSISKYLSFACPHVNIPSIHVGGDIENIPRLEIQFQWVVNLYEKLPTLPQQQWAHQLEVL